MDYTQDELSSGRRFRTQNLMDGYTPALRVVPVLEWLRERRGTRAANRVYNGTEIAKMGADNFLLKTDSQNRVTKTVSV